MHDMVTSANLAPPSDAGEIDVAELRRLEALYCSYGDTVHYAEPPKLFSRCEGSFIYDDRDQPYLDLQMWYSAVNFGYRNPRLNDALKRQIDTLPQVASQYLHREKIELAARIAVDAEAKFGSKGRVLLSERDNGQQIYTNGTWTYEGPVNEMYQTEHDELFASIRNGKPINNGDYMTKSTLLAIMGRMAAYTGQLITWDMALNSKEDLGPKSYDWDAQVPVKPVAMPGGEGRPWAMRRQAS